MEIIRRETDYAVRALLYLAGSESQSASCRELADACDIPQSFAHKFLKKLATASVVTCRVGRAGGFQLNRPPERITLHDVLNAVQGPVSVSRCARDPKACPRGPRCPLSAQWRTLQDNLVGLLDDTTLTDLL